MSGVPAVLWYLGGCWLSIWCLIRCSGCKLLAHVLSTPRCSQLLAFRAMAFYRMGFLLASVYDALRRNPQDHDKERVLEGTVERWRDVPPKQLDRVRLGGWQFLGRVRSELFL